MESPTPLILRFGDRRHWLRAAKPGGDGGSVHVAGRSLRAWQRNADEQSSIEQMGGDLQGSDDDRCCD